jgi:hypothetical protein
VITSSRAVYFPWCLCQMSEGRISRSDMLRTLESARDARVEAHRAQWPRMLSCLTFGAETLGVGTE